MFKNLLVRSAVISRRGIWCHSSIKFDRLRLFFVIHRVLAIVFPFFGVFEFDQVRPTSIKCAFLFFVFSNFRVFVIGFHVKFAENEITRITKELKHEKMQPVVRASPDPAQTRPHPQGKQRTAADRPPKTTAARSVLKNCFPNCQRSIFVVRFWFRKSRRAGPKRPES